MVKQIITQNSQRRKKKAVGGTITFLGSEHFENESGSKIVEKWLIRIYLGCFNGVKKHKNFTFRGTWQEAQEELIRVKGLIKGGIYDPFTDKHTIKELIDRYKETEFSKLSPITRRNKESLYNTHILRTFSGYLKDVNIARVQDFLSQLIRLNYSSTSILQYFKQLKVLFNYAVKIGWLNNNPCNGVKLPRAEPKREIVPFTIEEIKKVLNYTKQDLNFILIRIALVTGARPSEYTALKWEDVDFENNTIAIRRTAYFEKGNGIQIKTATKTKGSKRVIKIDKDTAILLRKLKLQRPSRDFIFIKDNGKLFSVIDAERLFNVFLAKLGFNKPMCLYWLRHSSATYLLNQGLPIKDVSYRLGHKSPFMLLNVYSRVLEANQSKAAMCFESGYINKQLIG